MWLSLWFCKTNQCGSRFPFPLSMGFTCNQTILPLKWTIEDFPGVLQEAVRPPALQGGRAYLLAAGR
jgi:hypothetical protein